MAGIGFELKKIINKGESFSYIKTYLFSSIVTVGPTIMCILMVTFFQLVMIYKGVDITKREFFMAAIMYCFMFSMIVTGVVNMPLSRYISDLIYKNKIEKIMPSMFGAITICLIAGSILTVGFFATINCPFNEKILMYLFFEILLVIWIEMIYISAIKDYLSIVKGFVFGIIVGLILGSIILIMDFWQINIAIILANLISFTIIAISFMITLIKSLKLPEKDNYFEFIKCFDQYKTLVLTSFLLTFSVYLHNIIFWFSKIGLITYGNFHLAPNYDLASFFAFLSVMPSLVMFVVFMETSFYLKFKDFLNIIENGGSLDDIKKAKKEVAKIFKKKFQTLLEVQLIFTLCALMLGVTVFPRIGITALAIEIFLTLALGYYFYIWLYITILIILYFDDQKGGLKISLIFFSLNLLLSLASTFLNETFYGIGFTVAALISLIYGFKRLKIYFHLIEYHILKSGEVNESVYKGIFTKAYTFFAGGVEPFQKK